MKRVLLLALAGAASIGAASGSQNQRFTLVPAEYLVFQTINGKSETRIQKTILKMDAQTGTTWTLHAYSDSAGQHEYWTVVMDLSQ